MNMEKLFGTKLAWLLKATTKKKSQTKMESIRMLLAFVCFKNCKLFQMDIKNPFLNSYI